MDDLEMQFGGTHEILIFMDVKRLFAVLAFTEDGISMMFIQGEDN